MPLVGFSFFGYWALWREPDFHRWLRKKNKSLYTSQAGQPEIQESEILSHFWMKKNGSSHQIWNLLPTFLLQAPFYFSVLQHLKILKKDHKQVENKVLPWLRWMFLPALLLPAPLLPWRVAEEALPAHGLHVLVYYLCPHLYSLNYFVSHTISKTFLLVTKPFQFTFVFL